jgi:HPt (histidine-containing phosphotransfer) domain-containing protein
MDGAKEEYIAAGMDDYLSKPIDPKLLLAKLQARATAAAAADARAPDDCEPKAGEPVGAADAAQAAPEAPSEAGDLDPGQLSELATVLSPEELRELLTAFLTGLNERREALRARLAGGDRVALGREAHALAGVAGNFGASRVAALARKLEAMCAGHESGDVAALVDAILAACVAAAAAVEARLALHADVPVQADAAQ